MSILVYSDSGKFVAKPTLAAAANDNDTLGKKVVITSPVNVGADDIAIIGRTFDVVGNGQIVYDGTGRLTFGKGTVDFVRPEWWTPNVSPGVTPMADAFNYAHLSVKDQAHRYGKAYVKLTGDYLIEKTVNYIAPMRGSDLGITNIICSITDGSPCIYIEYKDNWDLREFYIRPSTIPLTGGANYIGIQSIQIYDPNNLYLPDDIEGWGNQWFMQNLRVDHALVGIDIEYGWIGTAIRVKITNCDTGLRAIGINATRLDMDVEANVIGMDLTTCSSVEVSGVIEGNTTCAVKLNDVAGFSFAGYMEHNIGKAFELGRTTACRNFSLRAGTFSGDEGSLGIDAYAVDGFSIDSGCTVQYNFPIVIGSLCTEVDTRNLTLTRRTDLSQTVYQTISYESANGLPRVVQNLFPNPKLINGFAGNKSVSLFHGYAIPPTVSTYETVTTGTIHGSGVKFTSPVGTIRDMMTITLPDDLVTYLRGKSIEVVAKLYIPYTVDFDNTVSASSSLFVPNILITSTQAVPTYSVSEVKNFRAGAWNDFNARLTIDAAATAVTIAFSNSNRYVAPDYIPTTVENYYIIGEILMYEGYHSQADRTVGWECAQQAGKYVDGVWYPAGFSHKQTYWFNAASIAANTTATLAGAYAMPSTATITNILISKEIPAENVVTNYVKHSGDFTQSAWALDGAGTSVAGDVVSLPNEGCLIKQTTSLPNLPVNSTVLMSAKMSGTGTVSMTIYSGAAAQYKQITLTGAATVYEFNALINNSAPTLVYIYRRAGDTATSVTCEWVQLENIADTPTKAFTIYVATGATAVTEVNGTSSTGTLTAGAYSSYGYGSNANALGATHTLDTAVSVASDTDFTAGTYTISSGSHLNCKLTSSAGYTPGTAEKVMVGITVMN